MKEKYLKIGKVSEKILNRLIFSGQQFVRPEVLKGPMLGEDCGAIALKEDEIMMLSTDPITATEDNIGYLSVHITLNDLATSGAEPIGLMVTILLPPRYTEQKLENLWHQLQAEAYKAGLAIIGGHTEVTEAVNRAVISVTGVAKIKKSQSLLNQKIEAGDTIIMTKYAGLEGTAILAEAKAEELNTRYAGDFVERAKALAAMISVLPEARVAIQTQGIGLKAMHDVTEGGVFGALWELSMKANLGFEIALEQIPILQETVEITEFFDLNPYKLISSGALLLVAKDGKNLVKALTDKGIVATVIGRFSGDAQRKILYSGTIQSMLPPVGDEIYKVL